MQLHRLLRARLGEDVYGSWFRTLQLHALEDGGARVSFPVRFLRNWVQTHYMDGLLEGLRAVSGGDVARVELLVRAIPAPGVPEQRVRRRHVEADEGRIRVASIISAVSRAFGISRSDLLSPRRHQSVVMPRQIAMHLASSMTNRSFAEIGQRIGGRDATTVLHAVRKIDRLMDTDAQLRARIGDLRQQLLGEAPAEG